MTSGRKRHHESAAHLRFDTNKVGMQSFDPAAPPNKRIATDRLSGDKLGMTGDRYPGDPFLYKLPPMPDVVDAGGVCWIPTLPPVQWAYTPTLYALPCYMPFPLLVPSPYMVWPWPPLPTYYPPMMDAAVSPPMQQRCSCCPKPAPMYEDEQISVASADTRRVALESGTFDDPAMGKGPPAEEPTTSPTSKDLRTPWRYDFDAVLETRLDKSADGAHARCKYTCSYPGVSWNSRMASWIATFEDLSGRGSRTFNPRRFPPSDYRDNPFLAGQDALHIAMHVACCFSAHMRFKADELKARGVKLRRPRSQSFNSMPSTRAADSKEPTSCKSGSDATTIEILLSDPEWPLRGGYGETQRPNKRLCTRKDSPG